LLEAFFHLPYRIGQTLLVIASPGIAPVYQVQAFTIEDHVPWLNITVLFVRQ